MAPGGSLSPPRACVWWRLQTGVPLRPSGAREGSPRGFSCRYSPDSPELFVRRRCGHFNRCARPANISRSAWTRQTTEEQLLTKRTAAAATAAPRGHTLARTHTVTHFLLLLRREKQSATRERGGHRNFSLPCGRQRFEETRPTARCCFLLRGATLLSSGSRCFCADTFL